MSKAPIAQPNSSAAPSGPTSPAFGSGAAPIAPKSNGGKLPNHTLVTQSLGVVNPPAQDFGKGQTGPNPSAPYNPSTMQRP